jgi:plastocyanin
MRINFLAILALAALCVLAVACGDDDDDTGTDGGNETDAATTAPAGNGNGEEPDVSITIEGSAFNPDEFTVPADGDVVIGITNEDTIAHTFTVYTDAEFTEMQGTTLPLDGGAGDTVFGTFPAGEYFFRCEIHPAQMQGSFTAE